MLKSWCNLNSRALRNIFSKTYDRGQVSEMQLVLYKNSLTEYEHTDSSLEWIGQTFPTVVSLDQCDHACDVVYMFHVSIALLIAVSHRTYAYFNVLHMSFQVMLVARGLLGSIPFHLIMLRTIWKLKVVGGFRSRFCSTPGSGSDWEWFLIEKVDIGHLQRKRSEAVLGCDSDACDCLYDICQPL